MTIRKITKTMPINVQGQSCTDDCITRVWVGKKETEGSAAGCVYTYQYSARYSPFY